MLLFSLSNPLQQQEQLNILEHLAALVETEISLMKNQNTV